MRKNSYNGRNVYGQRCIAKFVKLEKETAVDQYLAILADLDTSKEKTVEYTFDSSCFTREEAIEFSKKITRIMALRSNLIGKPYVSVDITLPRFSA